MALSTTQKYTVLRYLGWPIRTIDSTYMGYSNIITNALSSFPAAAEPILVDMLDRMEEIDGQIQSMVARSNVKSVDDIEFFEDGSYGLRSERSKLVREIACLIDIGMGPGSSCGMVGISV